MRWRTTREEVALFGANYVLPTASDYRAAGYLHGDRKRMIEEDMAQFARMGWDGLRLTFWGDWESSDSAGNLIANDHLDLLDWLIARARERGIYMLFSPIQLYNANWPDALDDTTSPGFGRRFSRERMGTDPAAIAAQVNYLRQILEHVNPYTGVALKDEPSILFIELVNEPVHHPEDLAGSVRYINALTDAVRSTGCEKLIFYNVSQDFRIGEAIRRSKAQGVIFGWYPTGLNAGYELRGNYLRGVDEFPDMLRPELAGLPRIVYEFDSPDLRNATMYPAMARTFRRVGAQFARHVRLRHAADGIPQPRLADALPEPGVHAAEGDERRHRRGGDAPAAADAGLRALSRNTRFGDFRISAEENLAELVARRRVPVRRLDPLRAPGSGGAAAVAGYGSSPIVTYAGEGVYFLDRVEKGVWRLEVYPDAVPVRDPFEPPSRDKVVTRAISRTWPMTVRLPDLGESFVVQPIADGKPAAHQGRAADSSRPTGSVPAQRGGTGGAVAAAGARRAHRIGGVPRSACGRSPPTIVVARRDPPTSRDAAPRCVPWSRTRRRRTPSFCTCARRLEGPIGCSHGAGRRLSLCRDGPEGGAARGAARVRDHRLPWASALTFPGGAAASPPTGTTSNRRPGTSTSWARAPRSCSSIPPPTPRGSRSPGSAMRDAAGSSALASPSGPGVPSSTWRCRWTRAAGARPTMPPPSRVVDRVRRQGGDDHRRHRGSPAGSRPWATASAARHPDGGRRDQLELGTDRGQRLERADTAARRHLRSRAA